MQEEEPTTNVLLLSYCERLRNFQLKIKSRRRYRKKDIGIEKGERNQGFRDALKSPRSIPSTFEQRHVLPDSDAEFSANENS
jgi:hypothetical protein